MHAAIESSLSYHLKKYYALACAHLQHGRLRLQQPQQKTRRSKAIGKKATPLRPQQGAPCADCSKLSAKSVRQFFATKYVEQATEDQLLGLAAGPNPLNHTDMRMTVSKYAGPDAANKDAAWRRLTQKAKTDEEVRTRLEETRPFGAWLVSGVGASQQKLQAETKASVKAPTKGTPKKIGAAKKKAVEAARKKAIEAAKKKKEASKKQREAPVQRGQKAGDIGRIKRGQEERKRASGRA